MADENSKLDDNRKGSLLFASDLTQQAETRRVTPSQPLPVDDFFFLTETLELPTNGTQVIVTPSSGKRICVKGATISPVAGIHEAFIHFQNSGKLIHKVYRANASGVSPKVSLLGDVDEPVAVTSVNAGQRCFFSVNYIEV